MVGSHSHARELHASHFIPPLLCVHGWDMNTSRICPTFYGSTCIVVATSRYVESFTLLTLSVHVNLAALYIYCAFFIKITLISDLLIHRVKILGRVKTEKKAEDIVLRTSIDRRLARGRLGNRSQMEGVGK